jgi:hypothetical protein
VASTRKEIMGSVFAFEHCYNRFESQFAVQSMHSSKAGAYRAMMQHKRDSWYEERRLRLDPVEIGWLEMWRIKEYKVD